MAFTDFLRELTTKPRTPSIVSYPFASIRGLMETTS